LCYVSFDVSSDKRDTTRQHSLIGVVTYIDIAHAKSVT